MDTSIKIMLTLLWLFVCFAAWSIGRKLDIDQPLECCYEIPSEQELEARFGKVEDDWYKEKE